MGNMLFTLFGILSPMGFYLAAILFAILFFGIYVPRNERKKRQNKQKSTPKAPIQKSQTKTRVAEKPDRYTVSFRPDAPDHQHITGAGLSTEKQLEQLEVLKNAGLIDDGEYQDMRKEIMKGL